VIFVDDAIHYWRGRKWCHLFADRDEELHDFAKSIGLKREWFQSDWRLNHYDITEKKRELAIKRGAIAVDRRFVYARIKRNTERTRPEREARAVTHKDGNRMSVPLLGIESGRYRRMR
jgi:hypothetical protein